eukprot:11634948-Alexandrium_andersonii.AAC.1
MRAATGRHQRRRRSTLQTCVALLTRATAAAPRCRAWACTRAGWRDGVAPSGWLSLIHISEPTRLALI